MRRYLALLVPVFALTACSPPPEKPEAGSEEVYITRYSKAAKFEDVREDLKFAIENRGLVIDHTSFINNMLERTGKDLGTTTKIYIDGVGFSFCSAVVSRMTMEADPHNIAYCPYTLLVYTPVNEPDTVYVAYRRPQLIGGDTSKASLKDVEKLLDGIAREALQLK